MRASSVIVVFLVVFALNGPSLVMARQSEFRFEHITTADGFVGNGAFAIQQDSQGFMWFGTPRGLQKYDGYGFTTYQHDPEDPYSLRTDWILTLYEDQEGVLWVGSDKGLHRFDRATERFFALDCVPDNSPNGRAIIATRVHEDRGGLLWLGTDEGLCSYDRTTQRFTHYQHEPENPESLSHNRVKAIFEDREENLWIGTASGLNRFDRETGSFTRFEYDSDNPAELNNDNIYDISESRKGGLWIGTEVGICRLVASEEPFDCHAIEPGDPEGWFGWVDTVHEGADGIVWIAAVEGPSPFGSRGLIRFDPRTKTFSRFPYDPTNPEGFLGNRVRKIYEDRSGTLWIATNFYGINKLDRSTSKFTTIGYNPHDENSLGHSVVWGALEDRAGNIWIGTDGGLDRIDRSTNVFTHFRHDPDDPLSLSYTHVNSLHEDHEGVLWVGTWGGGLDRLDRSTGTFSHHRHDPDDPTSISGDRIESILEDREGNLWIGTWSGLNRYDRETNRFTRFMQGSDEPNMRDPTDIFSLYNDSRGQFWAGTGNGLNRLIAGTDEFERYLYHPDTSWLGAMVQAISNDKAGKLWVSSGGEGLLHFDPMTQDFDLITGEDALLKDIAGIVADATGHLWISTEGKGIVKYTPETGEIRQYDFSDGLPSLHFLRGAYHQTKSGEIFFGSYNGLVAFRPEEVRDNPHVPPVVLTGLSVQNKEIPIGEGSPLDAHISVAKTITLGYRQNDFALSFVALNFQHSEKNHYAYKLEAYDEDWIEGGTSRQARYTNIPPGEYTFRVRGSNNDGLWNEEGASIQITITPPFWQTWWFRLCAIVAVLGLAYTAYRNRMRRIVAYASRLEAQVTERTAEVQAQAEQLRELDQIKSRFFANISHEFRTPLTLMLGPVQDALHGVYGELDERLRQHHEMMRRNGQRLLRLINQLLDLSKLEAGSMTIRARRADFVPLFKATVQAFASMGHRKNIRLRVDVPEKKVVFYFEQDKLEKVLFNLLSNAFKFTPEHGTIVAGLKGETNDAAGFIAFFVRNSGQGIPEEELPYIFDRFHQADDSSTRAHEGTGIGLALTKELVTLHGGTIHVDNDPGFSATFVVRLPKGRAHLHDDEITNEDLDEKDLTSADLETPLQAIDEVVAAEKRLHERSDNGATMTAPDREAPMILIVEDNADVRSYLKSHLAADYRVEEATDGVEGLEKARAIIPDMVISDVMMPRMDGYELCRTLKSDDKMNHIPVVLLTAKADEESKREGLETGADDYLYKPFHAEELLVRVENLIEIRRQLRAHFSGTVVIKPSDIEVTSTDAALLERVREIVEGQLANGLFSTDMLADEVGLSRRQLDRKLKALTKLSASGYLRMMRLERAAQLLEQHGGNVSEVAYQVGFHKVKHFSKLFRQTFGVLPSDYARPDAKEQ